MSDLPKIDVVIRSPGWTPQLDRALLCLTKQTGVEVCPIIVMTKEVDRFSTPHFANAVVVPDLEQPFNYSRALNVGFAAGTAEHVLSFSSHCEIMVPDALAKMIAEIKDPAVIAVSCETPNVHSADWLKQSSVPPTHFDSTNETFNGNNGLSNPCGIIRRKDWEARGFQEDIATAEDQEWAMVRLREPGTRAVYFRGLVVSHNPAICLEKLWRERVVVAARVHPPTGSWRNILRDFKKSLTHACGMRWNEALLSAGMGFHTARYRITGHVPTSSPYGVWKK